MISSVVFYLVIFLVESLLSDYLYKKLQGYECNRRKQWLFILLSSLPCVLVSSIRTEVGTDYYNYYGVFRAVARGVVGEIAFLEPGYVLLINLCNLLGAGVRLLFIVSALIFGYGMKYAIFGIAKELEQKSVFVVAFFANSVLFGFSMNGIRQALAIAFVSVGIYYLIRDDKNRFCIMIVIGALFHITAISFLAMLFIRKNMMTPKQLLVTVSTAIVMLVVISRRDAFVNLFEATGIGVVNKFSDYLSSGINVEFVLWKNLIISLPFFSSLIFYKDIERKSKYKASLLLNICIFEIFVLIASQYFAYFFRFRYFMKMAEIMLIPYVTKKIHPSRLITFAYICYGVFAFVNASLSGLNGILPYSSLWFSLG